MNPIDNLYNYLSENGFIDDSAFPDVEAFAGYLSDPKNRKDIHDQMKGLERQQSLNLGGWTNYDLFEKEIGEAVSGRKKKEVGGQDSAPQSQEGAAAPTAGDSSPFSPFQGEGKPDQPEAEQYMAATPSARADAAAKVEAKQTAFDPFATPPPVSYYPNVDPAADPLAEGMAMLDARAADPEYRKKYASQTEKRRGDRAADALMVYGEEIKSQYAMAAHNLSKNIGEDWEKQLNDLDSWLQDEANQQSPDYASKMEKMQSIVNGEDFARLNNAVNAYKATQNRWVEYMKAHPEYKEEIDKGKMLQVLADVYSNSVFAGNTFSAAFAGRKAVKALADVASLPRLMLTSQFSPMKYQKDLSEAIVGGSEDNWGWADWLGSTADSWVEKANMYMPLPSYMNRPIFDDLATVTVDGKKYDVSVKNGQPQAVYMNGDIAWPNADTMEKIQTELATAPVKTSKMLSTPEAVMQMSGKSLDVLSDLIIARYTGGGSKIGTMLSTAAMTQRDAFTTAIADYNYTSADAANYAMATSIIEGAIEAYVGNIETAFANPGRLKALKRIGKMEAMAASKSLSPSALAVKEWMPILKEVGMENAEEGMQMFQDLGLRAVFNETTGGDLDTGFSKNEIAETALLTTIVTMPMAMIGAGGGMADFQRQALITAVAKPEQFALAMNRLVNDGVISQENAQAEFDRIQRYAEMKAALPSNLTEEAKNDVLLLNAARESFIGAAANQSTPEPVRKQYEAEVAKIDKEIERALNGERQAEADTADQEQIAKANEIAQAQQETPSQEATQAVSTEPTSTEAGSPPTAAIEQPSVSETPVVATPGDETATQTTSVTTEDINPAEISVSEEEVSIDSAAAAEQGQQIPTSATDVIGTQIDALNSSMQQYPSARQKIVDEVGSAIATKLGITNEAERMVKISEVNNDFEAGSTLTVGEYIQQKTSPTVEPQAEVAAPAVEPQAEVAAPAVEPQAEVAAPAVESKVEVAAPAVESKVEVASPTVEPQAEVAAKPKKKIKLPKETEKAVDKAVKEIASDEEVETAIDNFFNSHTKRKRVDYDAVADAIENNDESFNSLPEEAKRQIKNVLQANRPAEETPGKPIAPGKGGTEKVADQGKPTAERSGSRGVADTETGLKGARGKKANNAVKKARAAKSKAQVEEAISQVEEAMAEVNVEAIMERVDNLEDRSTETMLAVRGLLTQAVEEGLLTGEEAMRALLYRGTKTVKSGKKQWEKAQSVIRKLADPKTVKFQANTLAGGRITVSEDGDMITVQASPEYADNMKVAGAIYTPFGWVMGSENIGMAKVALSLNPLTVKSSALYAFKYGFYPKELNRITRMGLSAIKLNQAASAFNQPGSFEFRVREVRKIMGIGGNDFRAAMPSIMSRLQAAFPDVEIITDKNEIARVLAANSERIKKDNGLDWTVRVDDIKGFEYNGKIYINMDNAGIDTPIHEFGHIWLSWLKKNNEPLYKSGLDLISGTIYHTSVKSHAMYSGMSEEGILEEALAVAIGERGAMIAQRSNWQKFKDFLSELFTGFKAKNKGFNENMSLLEFTDTFGRKALSGKELMAPIYEAAEAINNTPSVVTNEDGSVSFQFIGANAASRFDHIMTKLWEARHSEMAGMPAEQIWTSTGWFRGTDGMWRYQIDPSKIRMREQQSVSVKEGETEKMKMGDLIDYPTLFKYYPDLKDANVYIYNEADESGGFVRNGEIYLNIRYADEHPQEVTLIHEFQHIIQEREGFARGISTTRALLYKAAGDFQKTDPSFLDKSLKEALDTLHYGLGPDLFKEFGIKEYLRSAGEADARLVEAVYKSIITGEDPGGTGFPWNKYDVHPSMQVAYKVFSNVQLNIKTTTVREYLDTFVPMETFSGPMIKFQAASSAASVQTAQLSLSQAIAHEIKTEGQANVNGKIKKFAYDFGLDPMKVREEWEIVSAQMGYGKITMKANEPKGFRNKSAMGKISTWTKKWFWPDRGQPEISKWARDLENKIAGRLERMQQISRALNNAIEKQLSEDRKMFGGRKTNLGYDIYAQMVNNAMTGASPMDILPNNIRNIAERMREELDKLSMEIATSGANGGKMTLTILANAGVDIEASGIEGYVISHLLQKPPHLRTQDEVDAINKFLENHRTQLGNYMYRSYRIHDDPKWKQKIPVSVQNAARAKVSEMIQERISELETLIQMKEDDIQEEIDAQEAILIAAQESVAEKLKEAEAHLANMVKEQTAYVAKKGVESKAIEKRINAAVNAVKIAKAQKNDVTKMALMQIAFIETLPPGQVQSMSMAAKQVISSRKRINQLEGQLAKASVAPKLQEELESLRDVNPDDYLESLFPLPETTKIIGGSALGSKDLSSFKMRKDIPEEIRAFMGEYETAEINFVKTFTRLATLVEQQYGLIELKTKFGPERQNQDLPLLFSDKRTEEHTVPIASEGSAVMSPLNGMYVSPELYDAMKTFYTHEAREGFLKWYFTAVSMAKYGKTILSPVTHFRNGFSNLFLAIGNGHVTRLASSTAWNYSMNRITSRYGLGPEMAAEVEKLSRLGVVGDGLQRLVIDDIKKNSGVIRGTGEALGLSELRKEADNSPSARIKLSLIQGVNWTLEKVETMYALEDEYYKIAAFYTERDRYTKAFYKKAYDELTPEQQDEMDMYAAELVTNILPTYSKMPMVFQKFFRNWPFTGTFVAFPSEMIRTQYNTAAQIFKDLSRPETRAIGAQRMAWQAGLHGMLYGVYAYAKAAFGWDDDDFKAVRRFARDWQKTGTIIPLGRPDDAIIEFMNLSYTDPTAFWKDIFWRWQGRTDESIMETARLMLYDQIEPFVSQDLFFGTIWQIASNEVTASGKRIYTPDLGAEAWTPGGVNFQNVTNFVTYQLQPGVMKFGSDVYSAATGTPTWYAKQPKEWRQVWLGLAGWQKERLDLDKTVGIRFYIYKEMDDVFRKDFNKSLSIIRSDVADGFKDAEVGEREATELYEQYNDAIKEMSNEMLKDLKYGFILGAKEEQAAEWIRRFNSYQRTQLRGGKEFELVVQGYNK